MTIKSKIRALELLASGDSEKRWVIAEKFAKLINKQAILGEHNKIWRNDIVFLNLVKSLPCNERQWERLYLVHQVAKYCSTLPGDFVECGTHSGSSAYFLCLNASNEVFLFDSWEGLSLPTIADGSYWSEGDLKSNLIEAERTLSGFDNKIFLKGWIPNRFDEVSNKIFSFIHIDVDIFEPTILSLEFFWDKLTPGGVLICDDYGFLNCAGAKHALDTFFEKKANIISLPTGQAMVIKN